MSWDSKSIDPADGSGGATGSDEEEESRGTPTGTADNGVVESTMATAAAGGTIGGDTTSRPGSDTLLTLSSSGSDSSAATKPAGARYRFGVAAATSCFVRAEKVGTDVVTAAEGAVASVASDGCTDIDDGLFASFCGSAESAAVATGRTCPLASEANSSDSDSMASSAAGMREAMLDTELMWLSMLQREEGRESVGADAAAAAAATGGDAGCSGGDGGRNRGRHRVRRG